MPALDQGRLFATLTYAVIALFLSVAVVSMRYRPGLRRAAIVLYLATLALALAVAALWLAGVR